MHLYNFYHGHRLKRFTLTDFWLYELSVWLHTLAMSLISVFIPAILIQDGYALSDVIHFYLIYNIIDVPLNFAARELVVKHGARWAIAAATVFAIIFFYLFLTLHSKEWSMVILMCFVLAIYDSLYWVASLYLFIESDGKSKSISRSTGILYGVKNFAALFGPLIGAGIIVYVGHSALLVATIAMFVLALMPLLSVDDFPDRPAPSLQPVAKFFDKPRGRHIIQTICLYGIHDSVEHTLFPLFIFLVFGTIQSVAGVAVAMSLTAIFFSVALGKVDPVNRERAIALGALLIALIWISRLLISNNVWFYASICAAGLFQYLILVPLDGKLFDYGRSIGDSLSASVWRNVAFMGANVVLYGILALLVDVFNVSFIFAALCLFGVVALNTIFLPKEELV